MDLAGDAAELWCWRHPRAEGAAGRCIGRTDLPVARRRAKRLAHRIRSTARRHALPHEVWVSPLRRCRDVGRHLQRWGWRVRVDDRLIEVDFGTWDGRPWQQIGWDEVAAWEADLLHHAPGAGESLWALSARVRSFVDDRGRGPTLLVTHGGWINALRVVVAGSGAPPDASQWPPPVACGGLWRHVGRALPPPGP